MTRPKRSNRLLLTCEHGGNRVPRAYAQLFRGNQAALESHRGWDPGALELARLLERRLSAPLVATTWSRLFVEANRSPNNARIWSEFTRELPPEEHERILERYWRPHRADVEAALAAAGQGGRVIHVAVHSFTPKLGDEVRNADVSLLYDSRRKAETAFCDRWIHSLRAFDPSLRIRRNYPYLGKADGLTTSLRKRHPESRYVGVELEINQALVGARAWRRLGEDIAASLSEAVAGHRAAARMDATPARA